MSSVIFFLRSGYTPYCLIILRASERAVLFLGTGYFLSAGDSVVEASARAVSVLDGSRLMRLYECKSSHSMAIISKLSCAVE
jgi:hypothetical protein